MPTAVHYQKASMAEEVSVLSMDMIMGGQFKELKGADLMQKDIDNIAQILSSEIKEQPGGYLVSFEALNKTGDVIHNFFGFFAKSEGKINEIYWSENAKYKIVSCDDSICEVQNAGVFAIDSNDVWVDYNADEQIELFTDSDIIELGGIFKVKKDVTIQNKTHGFFLEVLE
ncbi:MAG: hypothetical protein N4A36_02160 [Candidatus Gracilibacteria bacterium]|nr:hypothetical protein [Candidatus Gracilibacteria bacterium]